MMDIYATPPPSTLALLQHYRVYYAAYDALVSTLQAAAARGEVCPVGTLIQAIEENLPETLPCEIRYTYLILYHDMRVSTLYHFVLNICISREQEVQSKKKAAERGLIQQYVNKMTFKVGGIKKGSPGDCRILGYLHTYIHI